MKNHRVESHSSTFKLSTIPQGEVIKDKIKKSNAPLDKTEDDIFPGKSGPAKVTNLFYSGGNRMK